MKHRNKKAAILGLLFPILVLAGCTGGKTSISIAQAIVNHASEAVAAAQTVDTILATLDPALAGAINTGNQAFAAVASVIKADATAYLANPSTDKWTNLQTEVTAFEQSINASVLKAAGINNPIVLVALQGLGLAVTTILGFIQSLSTKAQLEVMSRESPIKLATVIKHYDPTAVANEVAQVNLETGNNYSVSQYVGWETDHGF